MDETELLLAAGCRRTAGPAKAWNVLRVKTADDATLRLPVDDLRRTTVGGVKRLIEARGGVAPARQRLFFGGRELADGVDGRADARRARLHAAPGGAPSPRPTRRPASRASRAAPTVRKPRRRARPRGPSLGRAHRVVVLALRVRALVRPAVAVKPRPASL